jgi:hypothetical protein
MRSARFQSFVRRAAPASAPLPDIQPRYKQGREEDETFRRGDEAERPFPAIVGSLLLIFLLIYCPIARRCSISCQCT